MPSSFRFPPVLAAAAAVLLVSSASLSAWWAQEWKSGIVWPEPAVVTPGEGAAPPSDAIVLFGGGDMSAWEGGEKWILEDDFAIAAKGGVTTKQAFGDIQLHLEYAAPAEVKGSGQGRGNSGVYLMGKYEVQILDSYENKTYFDGQCGAIYKQQPPLVNACRPPGEWNTYDILFTAPRFAEDGALAAPAVVTVLHNGVCIQNAYELQGGTSYTEPPSYRKHAEKLPIHLQFHGNPVRFRNIWVRELQPMVGELPADEKPADEKPADEKPADEKPAEAPPAPADSP